MKQTAVKWLIEKIQLTDVVVDNGEDSYIILMPNLKLKDIEKANQMFEQQIMDAHGKLQMFSKQYYEENYGSNEINKVEEKVLCSNCHNEKTKKEKGIK